MSDKDVKKDTKGQEQPEAKERVMTSYDRKMQRREEAKKQEEREKKIGMIVGVACVALLAVLVAYFPIKRYADIHGAYVTIDGKDISRAEFDYNYNLAINNFYMQYGAYLGNLGLDLSQDLSTQMYTDTMTWKDFFEEKTVDSIKQTKALIKEADAAGFTYDASADVEEFKASIKENAAGQGISAKEYLRQLCGNYVTLSSASSYLEEGARASKYYDKIAGEKAASDDEIRAYYEENKDNYDSVDYYVTIFEAELPTEPTELADKTDAAGETAAGETDAGKTAYKPSEAEIAKAMADARELADAADAKKGELKENMSRIDSPVAVRNWLFDASRKEGDAAVLEDETNHRYYVVSFVKRYLDDSSTANLRVIMSQELDGQAVLDEWAAGDATEESFADLCTKYSADSGALVDGGLFEGVARKDLAEEIGDWIFAEGRAAGDTVSITNEEGYTYVMYYISEGAPEWRNDIADILLNRAMSEYMEGITANITVEDKKGKLNYLKVRAQEAVEEENAETAGEGAVETEGGQTQ